MAPDFTHVLNRAVGKGLKQEIEIWLFRGCRGIYIGRIPLLKAGCVVKLQYAAPDGAQNQMACSTKMSSRHWRDSLEKLQQNPGETGSL